MPPSEALLPACDAPPACLLPLAAVPALAVAPPDAEPPPLPVAVVPAEEKVSPDAPPSPGKSDAEDDEPQPATTPIQRQATGAILTRPLSLSRARAATGPQQRASHR